MLELPADKPASDPSDARPSLAPGTLIFIGVWACVFAAFIVLGLRT